MTTIPTFTVSERARAAAWKAATASLPAEAKVPAAYVGKGGAGGAVKYDFCLPAEHAELSLLPEVRQAALALFGELGIPWHAGIHGGPGNHLLSSQVQCVNALGQMVTDPNRIIRAFGPVVGTTEVREIEPGRWLTFEYIGAEDYLAEAVGGKRTRGAHCTSVDAAFVHVTHDGSTELVLIEWKYTERYGQRTVDAAKDAVRLARYGKLLAAPDSPIDDELLPFEELLQEPLYQLMRQQLLAHELEKAAAHGADRVRVVHVLPAGNSAYQSSLHGTLAPQIGATVKEVWQRLLRQPDRFVSIDSALFLDPQVTSEEYVDRYGDKPSPARRAGFTRAMSDFWIDQSVLEAASWRLASELVRRHPATTRVVHTRPGGGQYDCLTITGPEGTSGTVQLNRAGTIEVHERFDGLSADRWDPTGWDEYLRADPREFLDRLERAAGLPTPSRVPPTEPMTLTYRVLAALAATAVKSVHPIEIQPGQFYTSDYGGGPNDALDSFPAIPETLRREQAADLFGFPGYRFWILLRDQVPILAFEQHEGMAWTPHLDDGIDLMGLYDLERHNLLVVTLELLRIADNV